MQRRTTDETSALRMLQEKIRRIFYEDKDNDRIEREKVWMRKNRESEKNFGRQW